MMKTKDFATFILTYGRADKVYTYESLREQGYTGEIYFVCSDDDKTVPRYKELYGDKVFVFSKDDYKGKFDIGDNFNDDRVVVYARNAIFDIAKELGFHYFLILDDDYKAFGYSHNSKGGYQTKMKHIKSLDKSFDFLLDYFKKTNAKTLCIAQGGDFIGGGESGVFKKKLLRKAMNFFICSVNRPFEVLGRINEDCTTYVRWGQVGDLYQTIVDLRLWQLETQSNSGGLTEFYLDGGTYVKSFYTVMFAPSCTKVTLMGNKNRRLHHSIKWNACTPQIVNPEYKKD